jgi:hypothetical protein
VQHIHFINSLDEQGRRDFGNYVSGLVDGEGCFCLRVLQRKNKSLSLSSFLAISMRDDDRKVIEMIRAYLGCGVVMTAHRKPPQKDSAVFQVSDAVDLVEKVIPHFEKHPLYAKKAKDFEIWKEGAKIIYQIRLTNRTRSAVKRTEEQTATFVKLHRQLREIRKYESDKEAEIVLDIPRKRKLNGFFDL